MTQETADSRLLGPLRIEGLVNGGAGIARDAGRVIFVPGTAPGDLVQCRLVKEKKRYAEGKLVEILEASDRRRKPPCPVAEQCGGCQWQHLSYAEQLIWKERLFHETLIRQCAVDPRQLLPIVPAADEWHYRSRVQIKCQLTTNGFITGFFKPKSHVVVPVESCPVIDTKLNECLATLRTLLAPTAFAGEIPQIDLAVGDEGSARAVVHYLGVERGALVDLLRQLTDDSLDVLIKTGRKNSLYPVRGHGELRIEVDQPPIKLAYAADGFAQINLQQNRQLVESVIKTADLRGKERILDLYCGMGNFSLPLARRAAWVCGVENFAPSIDMARRNAELNLLKHVEFHSRPAEGAWSFFSRRDSFDVVLLDPPRAGAYAVMQELLKNPVQQVIYVSCDPQTLARDLKPLLQGGYRLVSSQPFDLFPQTYHVESLTLLEYRAA